MTWIYVLRCYNNKYYVGKTEKKIMQRYKEHLTGKGSAWTRKYKPIELVECIRGDKFDEDKKTKEYMEKYGINNVRGGSYCQITLDKVSIASIKREIRGANDKCNKCGKSGHFASKCPYESDESNDNEEEVEMSMEDLETVFNEEEKEEGIYVIYGKKYLWLWNELYKESNNKTPKSLLELFRLNERDEYEDYNWKSIHTKTNKKLSVKKYCRRKGHIEKNCYANGDNEESESWSCEYCGKYFDSKKGARYHEQFYCRRYKKIQKCSRCNRKGHTVKQCYATTYATTYA